MQILIPEAVYFDLIENGEGSIELWASAGVERFRVNLFGAEVLFESNGRERDFGSNQLLQGFKSLPLTRTACSTVREQYPEVCLLASLRRVP